VNHTHKCLCAVLVPLLQGASLLSFVLWGITPSARANLYVAVVLVAIVVLTCLLVSHKTRTNRTRPI
jgi:hypothetical protein